MASELGLAESSSFRSDQFLFIIGGYGSGRLATTEILKPDGTVAWGPALPNAVDGHCAVTAKDGTVMLTGGDGSAKKSLGSNSSSSGAAAASCLPDVGDYCIE